MTVAYITHPQCHRHEISAGHPEQPGRLEAIEAQLRADGLSESLQWLTAPAASLEALTRAHDATYIERLRSLAPEPGQRARIDADTAMNEHSWDAALHAAGANLMAVDRVLDDVNCQAAFCAVRPPGHHAESARAMGFCLLNNVAIAALHALHEHFLERVAIVDFDVHYGNGTADIFARDERVLLCSLYQYPLYPLSEPPRELRNFSDLMLAPGADSKAFRLGVVQHWLPAIQKHGPELVLFSAGFDAHRDDPLADLRLLEEDFAWVTQQVLQIARPSCHGRCVSTLEGGYNLQALGRSASAHVAALLEFS